MLDRRIHQVGVVLSVLGAIGLIGFLAVSGRSAMLIPCLAYAAGLMATFICSAAYNLAPPSPRRDVLRRLDHAAIFIMIAGTYTPLTAIRLSGSWAVAMTATMWLLATAGVALKLFWPHRFERGSVLLYLALGWSGLVALKPLIATLDRETLWLLGAGAVLYSAGTIFHVRHNMRFQNAIWHGFVLTAAICHYAAILHGVVFATSAL
jgi:hemolysin III